ncbi:MAG: hypothetical protein WBD95_19820 [Xanthobacteraceae bacterium]
MRISLTPARFGVAPGATTLTLPLATETSSAATKEIALAPHLAVARILDLIR